MEIRRPPDHTLSAIVTLLTPYCKAGQLTPQLVLDALTRHDPEAGPANRANGRWLSVVEACAYLGGISRSSLYRYTRRRVPGRSGHLGTTASPQDRQTDVVCPARSGFLCREFR